MVKVVAITSTSGKRAVMYRTQDGAGKEMTFLIGDVFQADKTSVAVDPAITKRALNPKDWADLPTFCQNFGLALAPNKFPDAKKMLETTVQLFHAREERTRESACPDESSLVLTEA